LSSTLHNYLTLHHTAPLNLKSLYCSYPFSGFYGIRKKAEVVDESSKPMTVAIFTECDEYSKETGSQLYI
jgi:hypothetical protein